MELPASDYPLHAVGCRFVVAHGYRAFGVLGYDCISEHFWRFPGSNCIFGLFVACLMDAFGTTGFFSPFFFRVFVFPSQSLQLAWCFCRSRCVATLDYYYFDVFGTLGGV